MIPVDHREVMRLGACFTAASLLEVCIFPTPGLVSPRDSGAHQDMNMFTFVIGSSALAPYYTAFARIGWMMADDALPDVFAALRSLGVQAEADLLRATHGVNTQRGQLFLLGLAVGVAGVCLGRGLKVPSPRYFSAVREACQGLSARELTPLTEREAHTTGERLYVQGGSRGVRGEAEAGFPSVQKFGYPALQDGLAAGLCLNDAGVHALVSIMAELEDTTVLGRLGADGLTLMHNTAKDILGAGSVFSDAGREKILKCHGLFSSIRLSPGGVADLLALSLALYFVEHGFPQSAVLLKPSLFEER